MLSKHSKVLTTLALLAATILLSARAQAQEQWPLVGGDFWEITGIHVKDGGSWAYANWLATEWRKNLEFSKSQGWIKDYMILSNVYGRADEADLYLSASGRAFRSAPRARRASRPTWSGSPSTSTR